MMALYAARHWVPVPTLARWLLALGIAATLTANMGPGLVPRSRRGGRRGLAGGQSRGLVRTFWSGSSAPPGRQTAGRRQRTSATVRPAVLRRVPSRPQPLTATAPQGASATRQTRHGGPRVRAPGSRPSPPAGSVTMRCLGPALAMTRRWPRTGLACRPATRCRNAGSPRCSDAHLAAGRGPESPMHDMNRRSQTRRASQLRLTHKQEPPAVSPDAIVTAPGRSGIRARRSARCALWVNLDAMRVKGLVWPEHARRAVLCLVSRPVASQSGPFACLCQVIRVAESFSWPLGIDSWPRRVGVRVHVHS